MTESALQAIKPSKPEFQLKIFLHAVELDAEMDVMEDTHLEPGTISREPVLLLDGFTTPQTGAYHTLSPHAITTPPVNTNHAVPQNQPHLAKRHVYLDIQDTMKLINGLLNQFIQFHQQLKKSKLKS